MLLHINVLVNEIAQFYISSGYLRLCFLEGLNTFFFAVLCVTIVVGLQSLKLFYIYSFFFFFIFVCSEH